PERLKALRAYDVLDTPAEEAFDDLTRLAAQVCNAPIALVCLVDEDRQWFKSKVGLEISETHRDLSFCAHAVCQRDLFVVEDAAVDERFAHNPFVVGSPHIRFYAGMPLNAPEGGHAIGTLCVLDRQPRQLTPPQIEALRILSHQVITQLELRRNLMELERSVANHLRAEEALRQAEEKYRSIFWISENARVVRDVQGNVLYFEGTVEDITDRKRAEQAVRDSEVLYHSLVESLPQNIFRKDREGRFTFGNTRFCATVGKALEAIIGKTDADFFPAELAAKYQRD